MGLEYFIWEMNSNIHKAVDCCAKNTGQFTENFLIIATENWSLDQRDYASVSVNLKKTCLALISLK